MSGCVSLPLATPEQDRAAKLFNVDPEKASVYLFRKSSGYGAVITFPITLDGREVGQTKSGSFFLFKLNPGEHDIWVKGGDSVKSLNKKYLMHISVKKGEIYYLEQTASSARTPRLEFVDKKRGMNIVSKCDLLEEQKFKGPDVY